MNPEQPRACKGLFMLDWSVGCVFMSHPTAPPSTVPCEGCKALLIHRTHRELNPGLSCGSPLHYRCATTAPILC